MSENIFLCPESMKAEPAQTFGHGLVKQTLDVDAQSNALFTPRLRGGGICSRVRAERSSDSDVSDAAADLRAESAANYLDRNVPQKRLRIGRIFRIHWSAKFHIDR